RLSAWETGLVFGVQGVVSVIAGSLTPRCVSRLPGKTVVRLSSGCGPAGAQDHGSLVRECPRP
ncbi:hypothetical protein ABZ078_39080, partial [Streptomyces sp. NPDC006385]